MDRHWCQQLLTSISPDIDNISMDGIYHIHKKKLYFKYPFVIAHGTREYTDSLFLQFTAKIGGVEIQGWGEATIPPYLKENIVSVESFIQSFDWRNLHSEEQILCFLTQMRKYPESPCGQTIIEMCLLDILSQSKNLSLRQYLNLPKDIPDKFCSYTLSLGDSITDILKKLAEAPEFKMYKIKLTCEADLQKISELGFLQKNQFMVDANQAFSDPIQALKVINRLAGLGCVAMEQPLKSHLWDESIWLKKYSPIPIIADEAFQLENDWSKIESAFDGVNIKTLKVGGVIPALEIIKKLKEKNMLIQIGCMSESSLGCSYALTLVDDASYIDLDGPLLIRNDPFVGIQFATDGKLLLPYKIGIGAIVN